MFLFYWTINRYLNEYQKQYDEAVVDVQRFLSNPINAYVLVKRLTTDLARVESLMQLNSYEGIRYFIMLCNIG